MTAHPIAPMTDERLAELQAGFDAARLGLLFGVCDWRELRARLDAAEADRDAAVRLLKEGRHAFDDLNPRGKTIVDFLNVWLDQANDARVRLAAELAAAEARALPPARLLRTVEEVEGLADGRYLLASPNPCNRGLLFARPTAEPRFSVNGVPLWPSGVKARLVGATVVGPLPDVEPISAGED
jgi:hypothetical protein